MSAKLSKLMATRGVIEDEDIRREVNLIRENERRNVRNVPAVPAGEQVNEQPDDVSDNEQPDQVNQQNNHQPGAADRRDAMAAAVSDTESDGAPAAPEPRRRRRRLSDLIKENHELYNDFMKKKMPRFMRHFGLDSSSDD
ncbi:uncharacterized protein LOC123541479 [Mercenaria mercenaria]|uniref:uncharacterized protein LOC123541479 n=1 Tax=Mercenaria mercenaria TaxID=6596 RepID=UPI001E1E089C|nr:uncharacterized protein LOC123541479 [Mercenaria mercenaria]